MPLPALARHTAPAGPCHTSPAGPCRPHLPFRPKLTTAYTALVPSAHGASSDASKTRPQAQADVLDRLRTFLRVNLKPWDFTDNPHGDLTAY